MENYFYFTVLVSSACMYSDKIRISIFGSVFIEILCNGAWLQDAAILERIIVACFTFQLTTKYGRNGRLQSNEREISGKVLVHARLA